MNRETKLALLIGFVAIVVVTVLVGEHFGKARNATAATTELGTSNAAAPSATGLTVDPITSTPVGTPSAPVTQPGMGGGMVQPITLTNTPSIAGVNPGAQNPMVNADPNRFMPAAGVDMSPITPGGVNTGMGGGQLPSLPGTSEVPGTRPATTLDDHLAPGMNDGAPSDEPSTTVVSKGVEKMHPVARGETLSALALRYYGDRGLSKQLATYNAKRLGSNGTLREGVALRIPPRDVLMGAAVLSASAAGRTDAAPSAAEARKPQVKKPENTAKAEKPKTAGPRTYTIKKGDTLMTIASKELGSAKRWESLLIANPSLDENSLRPGMTIKIPAAK